MTPTATVLAFLKGVDKEKWRENLPITGDATEDAPRLKESFREFALQGTKRARVLSRDAADDDWCGRLAYELSKAALDLVDWEEVLKLWK